MVNSNPETVSTDYDTADRLYFEPLTAEDVLNIVENECGRGELAGIIVQFGGQTPLKLAHSAGEVHLRKRPPDTHRWHVPRTPSTWPRTARDSEPSWTNSGSSPLPTVRGRTYGEVRELARQIGYPVMVRPSYVLGGRAMEIVYNERQLREFMKIASEVSGEHPILVDRFLDGAIEVDVDADLRFRAQHFARQR